MAFSRMIPDARHRGGGAGDGRCDGWIFAGSPSFPSRRDDRSSRRIKALGVSTKRHSTANTHLVEVPAQSPRKSRNTHASGKPTSVSGLESHAEFGRPAESRRQARLPGPTPACYPWAGKMVTGTK